MGKAIGKNLIFNEINVILKEKLKKHVHTP